MDNIRSIQDQTTSYIIAQVPIIIRKFLFRYFLFRRYVNWLQTIQKQQVNTFFFFLTHFLFTPSLSRDVTYSLQHFPDFFLGAPITTLKIY